MNRLLITRVSGLMGINLAYYFRNKYEILGLYDSYPATLSGICTDRCDITDGNAVKKIVLDFNPSVIVHCAAPNDIDECDPKKDLSAKTAVSSAESIFDGGLDKDVKLVYISTDAEHDGVKKDYPESHEIRPRNYPSAAKHEGELDISKGRPALIFKASIFGWSIQDKKSFGEWILCELSAKRAITCFTDSYISSIYTLEFAKVIDIAIRNNLSGIYYCGSRNLYSKYEFAHKIADCFGLDKSLIKPTSRESSNIKTKRAMNLNLNVNKLQKALKYRLPDMDQSIEAFYKDYRCGLPEEIKQTPHRTFEKSNFIPYGRQCIDENDIHKVVGILRSDYLTQGPTIPEFERKLAEQCGAGYAIATNSATSALHTACLAAGIKTGDEVITSPITFVASANCVVYCGARPVFADIDDRTYNISPEEIEKKITAKTRAIIPVHFAGQSCDSDGIREVVRSAEKKFGEKISIIEDASHALGSLYKGHKVGSCAFSDMAVMSFHPVKHITTGEGGVVFTNDRSLCHKIRLYRSHGITGEPGEFLNEDIAFRQGEPKTRNPWYYEQIALGYNYRITDIQCALGLSQLKRLEAFRKRRREIVNTYNRAFSRIGHIQTPFESANCDSNFHLYVLLFNFEKIGLDRASFMIELKNKNIQTQVHYIPVHLQSFYRTHFGTNWGDCPNAEKYYSKCLSIPLHPSMTDQDVERVIVEITNLTRGKK